MTSVCSFVALGLIKAITQSSFPFNHNFPNDTNYDIYIYSFCLFIFMSSMDLDKYSLSHLKHVFLIINMLIMFHRSFLIGCRSS